MQGILARPSGESFEEFRGSSGRPAMWGKDGSGLVH